MATAWRTRGKRIAAAWQTHGNGMAKLHVYELNTAGFAALKIMEQAHFRRATGEGYAGGAPGVEVEVDEEESDHSHDGHGRAVRPRRA